MLENYSDYNMPSFSRQEGYAFDTLDLDLFHELSAISEEVGQCRQNQLG